MASTGNVTIGAPSGDNNDLTWIFLTNGGKITGFTIASDDAIYSLQFDLLYKDSKYCSAKFGGMKGVPSKINFAYGKELVNITGTIGDYSIGKRAVKSLIFTMNDGRQYAYGTPAGDAFNLSVSETFAGFCGKGGEVIEKLDVVPV